MNFRALAEILSQVREVWYNGSFCLVDKIIGKTKAKCEK